MRTSPDRNARGGTSSSRSTSGAPQARHSIAFIRPSLGLASRVRYGPYRAGASLMEIRLARHGRHIAIVTIDNQPRLNAMTRAMLAELGRLWDELQRDESCRAIVLTGAGTRAFTVGADIAGDLSAGPEMARMVNHALLKTDAYAKPIIAAINGDCVGGGLELMLASDVRAAAPEARFGLTEVKWSIYPFGGSTTKLVHQIGYVHAMVLLLTARLMDAEEAARLGLIANGFDIGEHMHLTATDRVWLAV